MIERCWLKKNVQNPLQGLSRKHTGGIPRLYRFAFLSLLLLFGLGVVFESQGVAEIDLPGFSQECTDFSHDPLLQHFLLQPTPSALKAKSTLAVTAPRLTAYGTALATYEMQPENQQNTLNLETIFGVSQGGQRTIVETTFNQESRAVVLSPYVLATVAHALTPDRVEIRHEQQISVYTVPLTVMSRHVVASLAPDTIGIPTQVVHINEPYDLALIQAQTDHPLQPFPYPATLSYGTGEPRQPVGGLLAGDCVAALVTVRDSQGHDTGDDQLVLGKVLTKGPVATNSLTQTKLNVNMFTTDLAVKPGDSGSPVVALRSGEPVLVGLVSATMYPTAAFTYVTRIDPLLAFVDALRLAQSRQHEPLSDVRTHVSEMVKPELVSR